MITPAPASPAACSAPCAAARRRCRPLSHRGRRRFSGQTRGGRYSWARYYHPGLARFISEDPIGWLAGDANFYAYVRNNPLSLRDTLGLQTGGVGLQLNGAGLGAGGSVSGSIVV